MLHPVTTSNPIFRAVRHENTLPISTLQKPTQPSRRADLPHFCAKVFLVGPIHTVISHDTAKPARNTPKRAMSSSNSATRRTCAARRTGNALERVVCCAGLARRDVQLRENGALPFGAGMPHLNGWRVHWLGDGVFLAEVSGVRRGPPPGVGVLAVVRCGAVRCVLLLLCLVCCACYGRIAPTFRHSLLCSSSFQRAAFPPSLFRATYLCDYESETANVLPGMLVLVLHLSAPNVSFDNVFVERCDEELTWIHRDAPSTTPRSDIYQPEFSLEQLRDHDLRSSY